MRAKGQIYTFLKITFRAIQSNPCLSSGLYHPWEGSCQKKIKILVSFEKMVPTNQKCQNFDQGTNLRAIQPNPPYDMLFMSSQRSFMQNKKKSYGTVFEKIHFKIFLI